MKLSIVIPVFNEAKTIKKIIKRVRRAPLPHFFERELIIIDDGSTDNTDTILKNLKEKTDLKIIHHDKNQGKGAALRTGFAKARGEIIIVQDADLEYDPQEYPRLLKPILKHKADVVYGSRFLGGRPHRILYYWHSVANHFLTWFSNMFSDLDLSDMETCYKVFRSKVIKKIKIEENRFGFEPEITAKIGELARNEEVRVYEVGISYYGRTYEEGKKIGMSDAFRAAFCIYKYNTSKFATISKYILNGIVIALSQFLFMVLLVGALGFNSKLGQNVSNIVSIELALIVAFLFHFYLTWRNKYTGSGIFIKKLINFHIISAISFLARVGLFYLLLNLGFEYKLNTLIGIAIAIIINFIGYDKYVFRNKEVIK